MKQRLSLFFLIVLRMAIGWHFLFEGIEKNRSVWDGPSEISKPWTSEPYFREAQGPLAAAMRWKIGDVDDLAIGKLTIQNGKPTALPEGLEREWNEYFGRFVKHYGVDPEQRQRATEKLAAQTEKTEVWFTAKVASVRWLFAGLWTDFDRKPFKRTYTSPAGPTEVNITVSERVEEYRAKLAEYRSLLNDKPRVMGKDIEKNRRAAVRGELAALRTELLGLVDERTNEMKKSLADVDVLTDEQRRKGPVPDAEAPWFILYVDWMTRYGLLVMGACLMLGLFSRSAALSGALFLVCTILTTPSLPWLPVPPNQEGYYLFISKNVIEMLALFMLACIPTGRWFGIDALIHALNPWRNKDEEES